MQNRHRKQNLGGRWWGVVLTASILVLCGVGRLSAENAMTWGPEWRFGGGLGVHFFEGDQETKHGLLGLVQAEYEWDDHWTVEGSFSVLPYLRANRIWSSSEAGDRPGLHQNTDSTWAAGLAVDGRYHFTRQYRLDPYISLGLGTLYYGDKRYDGDRTDWALRAGVGSFFHLSDTLAMRLDFRGMRVFNIGQANAQVSLGLAWRPGGRPDAAFQVMGGVRDSDGDGLSDWEEIHVYFTDPYHPDTDRDGVSDYDELRRYGTDPHNPDTDGDGLTDYEEIFVYGTDPLKRDTDDGGVDDWHEIMVDGTDPLDPADDLQLYTLYLKFDFDQALIRPEFHESLDVIALTLRRDPPAMARIEGHADRLVRSDDVYNQELSERRARAVKQYLIDHGDIASERLEAVGYGFQRPREPNDPTTGNPANRRVEIYIRSGEHIERHGVQTVPAPQAGMTVPAPPAGKGDPQVAQ